MNHHYRVCILQLTFVPSKTLANLSEVRQLDLSHNELPAPPSSAWHSMHHLRSLSLAGNPITKVLNDSFVGLERLEDLDISEIVATTYQVRNLENPLLKDSVTCLLFFRRVSNNETKILLFETNKTSFLEITQGFLKAVPNYSNRAIHCVETGKCDKEKHFQISYSVHMYTHMCIFLKH